jgi:hypothetical protein
MGTKMASKETGNKKTARVQVCMLIIGYVIIGLLWLAIFLENWCLSEPTWVEWIEDIVESDIYACLALFAPYAIFGFVLCTTKRLRIIVSTVIFLVFAIFAQCIFALKMFYSMFC